MKKILLIAASLIALASCTEEQIAIDMKTKQQVINEFKKSLYFCGYELNQELEYDNGNIFLYSRKDSISPERYSDVQLIFQRVLGRTNASYELKDNTVKIVSNGGSYADIKEATCEYSFVNLKLVIK